MPNTGHGYFSMYLGVTITANMKVSKQCGIAASKGTHIFFLFR